MGHYQGRYHVLLGLEAFKASVGSCLGTLEPRVVVLCSLTCQAREELPSLWFYRCACLLPHWSADQQIGTLLWTNTSLYHYSSYSGSLAGSQTLRRPPHPTPNTHTSSFFFCRESLSTEFSLHFRIGEGMISMVLSPFPSEWNVQCSLLLTYNGCSSVAFFHGGWVLPVEECPPLCHVCLLTAVSGKCYTSNLSCLTRHRICKINVVYSILWVLLYVLKWNEEEKNMNVKNNRRKF